MDEHKTRKVTKRSKIETVGIRSKDRTLTKQCRGNVGSGSNVLMELQAEMRVSSNLSPNGLKRIKGSLSSSHTQIAKFY